MKILVGSLVQESNTFSPIKSDIRSFESGFLFFGQSGLTEMEGRRNELAGFLRVCRRAGVELSATVAAWASSGGPMADRDFDDLAGRFLERVEKAEGIDGVLLALHGAWASESRLDADGWLLSRVRDIVGPDVLIVATLDMHANVTEAMLADTDALVGYQTYPHVDMFETGERAARLLIELLRGRGRPTMAACGVPMLISPHAASTFEGPLRSVAAERDRVQELPGILSASVFTVQPWLDVPELGSSAVVVTDGEPDLAKAEAERLARCLWTRRGEFSTPLVAVDEAVERAMKSAAGPVVLVDPADSVSAGSPGDGTAILKALLEARPDTPALVSLVDPEAARTAAGADGEEVSLTAGGRLDPGRSGPISLTGKARRVLADRVVYKGGVGDGQTSELGHAAVVTEGNVHVLLTEKSVSGYDPELYRVAGLEPSDAHIVVVKSPSNFRWTYRDIAREYIYVDTPGASTPRLKTLEFELAPRPLYPFEDWEWSPQQPT